MIDSKTDKDYKKYMDKKKTSWIEWVLIGTILGMVGGCVYIVVHMI